MTNIKKISQLKTKWRDILIGAFATLVATVFAGVIVYYITQDPPPLAPVEKLVYEIDTPVVFESDQIQISFTTLRVKNSGNETATNVVIGVEFDKKVSVIDKKISFSSGPAGSSLVKSSRNNIVEIIIPTFTPGENATVTILSDAIDDQIPSVGIKSNKSTGKEEELIPVVKSSETNMELINRVVSVIVPLAFISQLFVLLKIRRPPRFLRRLVPKFQSINNTAFVYLHSGLLDHAIQLLSDGISKSGAEPTMLANYGLALALKGNGKEAEKIFDAAEFWADENKHEEAVIAFNRAIVCFNEKNDSHGLALMRKAFQLSKWEIARYASYSSLLKELRKNSTGLHSLLNEFGVSNEKH